MRLTQCNYCEKMIPLPRRGPISRVRPAMCEECRCGIYGLADPSTGLIEYVGASAQIDTRFIQHRCDIGHMKKRNFVREHGADCVVLLERCDAIELEEREQAWIETARMLGHPLRLQRVYAMPHNGNRPKRAESAYKRFRKQADS